MRNGEMFIYHQGIHRLLSMRLKRDDVQPILDKLNTQAECTLDSKPYKNLLIDGVIWQALLDASIPPKLVYADLPKAQLQATKRRRTKIGKGKVPDAEVQNENYNKWLDQQSVRADAFFFLFRGGANLILNEVGIDPDYFKRLLFRYCDKAARDDAKTHEDAKKS